MHTQDQDALELIIKAKSRDVVMSLHQRKNSQAKTG